MTKANIWEKCPLMCLLSEGTRSSAFTLGLDERTGKLKLLVTPGRENATLTLTNEKLTRDRILCFPDADDTFVGRQTTDTLENKTLTSPVINTGDINTPDIDGGTIDGAAVTGGTINGAAVTGGTINSAPVGGTTPAAGAFTTLGAQGLSLSAQPAFAAYINSTHTNLAINTTTTLNFNTEHFDIGGNFDTATKTFTAPSAGIYLFGVYIRLDSLDTATSYYRLNIITTGRSSNCIYPSAGFAVDSSYHDIQTIQPFQMAQGDTAYATIFVSNSGTGQADIPASSGYSTFWGYKLG